MRARRPRRRWRIASAPAAVGALVVLLTVAAGCAHFSDDAPDLGPGVTARWMDLSRFSDRRALVVAPSAVRPGERGQTPLPLVVVVHGLGTEPETMARITGWPAAARDHGLIVAFADGLDHSFNAGGCCGTSAADGVDDVAYLTRLIGDAEDEFPVDRDRVYLTGHSNGGMMTYRFLCSHADLLAGAASVAGTNTTGCEPSAPVPFLQISGLDDPIVPLAGGRSAAPGIGPFPSVTGSVSSMAEADGCPAPVTFRKRPITATRWAPCRNGITVGLDVIAGESHGYPSTDTYRATDRILLFWGLA